MKILYKPDNGKLQIGCGNDYGGSGNNPPCTELVLYCPCTSRVRHTVDGIKETEDK